MLLLFVISRLILPLGISNKDVNMTMVEKKASKKTQRREEKIHEGKEDDNEVHNMIFKCIICIVAW